MFPHFLLKSVLNKHIQKHKPGYFARIFAAWIYTLFNRILQRKIPAFILNLLEIRHRCLQAKIRGHEEVAGCLALGD
jgi:hypothetical protein